MALSPQRKPDLTGLSICSGVGGLDLGLHLAEPGYRAVGYVERNAYCASTLVARMADKALADAPIWDDLKTFDGRPWRGKVSVVTGGYPCQPFTLSGRRLGEDDPRHLWPDVRRIVGEVAPEWVFFENVIGHLSLGFQDVAGDLQSMGFRVAACVTSAAEVGAGHIRERHFILGHANVQDGRQSLHARPHERASAVQACTQPEGLTIGASDAGDQLVSALDCAQNGGMGGSALPIFAPPPGDFSSWHRALQQRPELEPCLHGLDHGMADRVERSAAAGNGVAPMAAAWAWRYLKNSFGCQFSV